jgi:hypothetical protein
MRPIAKFARRVWESAQLYICFHRGLEGKMHSEAMLVTKGMSLKAVAKALARSEESTKNRAKQDKLKIQKMR